MKKLRIPIIISVVAIFAILLLLFLQKNNQSPTELEIISEERSVYIEGMIGEVQRLNPVLSFYNNVDSSINKLIYSSLFKQSPEGFPVGDIVESWGVSIDGLEYNLKLRENVLWHDGTNLTTNDVIFTIQTLKSPDSPAPEDVRMLWNSVEIIQFDEHTLQFKLAYPYAPFVDFMNFQIIPYHIYGSMSITQMMNQESNFRPIGSGPYVFDELILENGFIQGVNLKSNPDYYLNEPFIKNFNFRLYQNEDTLLEAYQTNQINGFISPSTIINNLAKQDINLSMYTEILPILNLIVLNLDNNDVSFFKETEVRIALLKAVNRDWIISQILENQAIIADSPIFPDVWAYHSDILKHEFNKIEAVEILQENGYIFENTNATIRSNGDLTLNFELAYPDMSPYDTIAEQLQADWDTIGVSVDLKPMDYQTLINDKLNPRNYQAALIAYDMQGYPDPDPYVFWHQTQAISGQNFSNWNNRLASEYLEQARILTDINARIDFYNRFQIHFSYETPAILLYYPTISYNVSVNIKGVQIGSLYDPANRFNYVHEWYFKEAEVLAP